MRQKIQSSPNILMMMIPFRVKFHGIKMVGSAGSTSKTGKTAPDIEVTSKVVPKSTTKYPKHEPEIGTLLRFGQISRNSNQPCLPVCGDQLGTDGDMQ